MTDTATQAAREAEFKTSLLELLGRANAFLEAAESEIPRIASRLREQELRDAMPGLGRMLDGLGSVAMLSVELERMGVGGRTEGPDLSGMSTALRRLVERQQQQDWAGAAGVLESNVASLLPGWRAALDARARAIGSC